MHKDECVVADRFRQTICVSLSFYFALYGRAATYFFCLTKKSKQKKVTPVAGLAYAKLPSLHMLLAAGASRFAPDRPCSRQNHVPFGCAKGKAARIMRFRQPEQNNVQMAAFYLYEYLSSVIKSDGSS